MPAPANAAVQVVDYDPNWPRIFRQLKDRIWPAVGDGAIAIEHVGSTSVPGLAGKAVIDLDVVIRSPADLPTLIERLETLGYKHRGNLGIEDRDAFAPPDRAPAHHLYVCPQESLALRNHLAVRDHLRTHPLDVSAYSALKKGLAEQLRNDKEGYVAGKTEFMLSILKRCGFADTALAAIRRTSSARARSTGA